MRKRSFWHQNRVVQFHVAMLAKIHVFEGNRSFSIDGTICARENGDIMNNAFHGPSSKVSMLVVLLQAQVCRQIPPRI